jgi:hypothetical protein
MVYIKPWHVLLLVCTGLSMAAVVAAVIAVVLLVLRKK